MSERASKVPLPFSLVGVRCVTRNKGRPVSQASFVIERATDEGEGVVQPGVAEVIGLEPQGASDSPRLTALRERHRELATLEPYLRAVVCLNDPWNL